MAKQLNVNLAFTADTGQAKQQIQALQQDLKNLVSATGSAKDFKLTKELAEAKEAAGQLGLALKNATTSAGTLDLSKFDQSLKASGMTLAEYRTKLSAMGPAGQQAFAKMAQSIVQAEVPLKRTNALLNQFKTTLVNTARWQLSSSMLHGFMGALQSAYGYAQNLNSSLNNIRIVTGATTDEMAVFADQANKAAQALSTSTTQYTDAALIYYQQGITDQKEIAERTETTIKLANVSRQSAEEVSQEMTAIWNNFDDGSHSLEYYADVITALGAATASSSEEISTGLEKFAAIAKTVGLSYEYATSALATITATTRQSADTVGTGLRTLFSRLESLSLGDTLEDGVDLNKYSEALEKVGVQVLDTSGELRDMDSILNDLGQRWGELGEAQKVALAQTVGGVRQYSNLIALMDNWDFMQQNLGVAKGAEGALQEQADIYAESWEAAQKRVKAAAQAIYSDLLDDDFFIALTNTFADLLKGIDTFIDAIGGLRTILPAVGLLMMNIFGPQMAQNIDNIAFNLQRNTEAAQKRIDQQKQEAYNEASKMFQGSDTNMGQAQEAALKGQLDLTFQLKNAAKNLTEEEIARYQASIDTVNAIQEQVVALGQAADKAKEVKEAQIDKLTNKAIRAGGPVSEKQANLENSLQGLKDIEKQYNLIPKVQSSLTGLNKLYEEGSISADTFKKRLQHLAKELQSAGFEHSGATVAGLQKAIDAAKKSTGDFDKEITKLVKQQGFSNNANIDIIDNLQRLAEKYNWTEQECQAYLDALQNARQAGQSFSEAQRTAAQAVEELKTKIQNAEQAMNTLGTMGQTIVRTAQGISQAWMGISSIVNALQTLTSPDASGWEKLNAVMMGIGMGLPMLINGYRSLSETFTLLNAGIQGVIAATEAQMTVENQNILVTGIANGLMKLKNFLHSEAVVAKMAEIGATEALTTAQWALNAAMDANPIGLIIIAIAALVAIIAGAITGINALTNAFSNQQTAAQKAEEASSNLAKQFQETKQEYDNLKSSISDYQNSLDALNTLARGTAEWKDQVRQTNTEALKLIDTLGLLQSKGDYSIDKDGVIHLNKDKLKEAEKEYSEKADKAEAMSTMADAKADLARAKADIADFQKEQHTSRLSSTLAGASAGLAAGAGLGLFPAVPGALMGAATGFFGQGAIEGIKDEKIANAIERLTEGDLAEEFSKGLLENTDDLADKLGIDSELVPGIVELAEAINSNTESQHSAAEIAAKTLLKDNKEVQKSGYAEEISKAAGNIYEKAYNDAYESKKDSISKDDYNKYAKLMGLTDEEGYKYEGKDNGNFTYSKIQEDGTRSEAIEVTKEEVAMALAAAEAEEQLANVSTELISQFENLDQVGDGASKALKDFLTEGNLAATKGKDLKDLQEKMGDKSAKEYLGTQLGDGKGGLSNEEAQALGYESAEALISAFEDAIANAESDIEKAGQDVLTGGLKRMFNQLTEGADISAAGKKILANQISQAFEQGGTAGVKALTDFYENIEPDKLEEVIQTMGDIDWSSITPTEFADKMDELGIAVDAANPGVANFIDMMREASGLSLEGAVASFHQLNEIADKINAYGDTISDKEYKELPAAAKEFFRENLDGEYELVGKAEDFKTVVEGIALNDAKELYNQGVNQQNAMGYAMENDVTGSAISSGPGRQMNVDTDQLAVQVNLVQALGEASGMTSEKVAELCNQDWENIDPTNPEDVQRCQELADAVGQLDLSEEQLKEQQLAVAESNQELANKMAMSAQTEQDLNDLYEAGAISLDTYNEAYKTLSNIDGVDEDHIEEMKELGEYYAENADEIKGLDKSLKGNQKACQDVAKVITRYSEAMESANENMETWRDGLNDSTKGSKKHYNTVKDLRKVYGDLANKDLSKLSDEFFENKDRLELLDKAMNGSEDAAKDLEDQINKEYLAEMGVDVDNFESDMNQVQSMAEDLTGQDFDDIEIGADLNDEGFRNALSDMVTEACTSAEQAEAYLAAMGIDAEVVEDTSTADETTEAVGVDVDTHPVPVSVSMPLVSAGSTATGGVPQLSGGNAIGHGSYDEITVSPHKEDETAKKEQKSFALKVKSAKRGLSSGGNFKHSAGGGGGGGGGCFIAGTLISTNNGFFPIEKIQPGDMVLSYNEQIKQNEYSEVLQTMIHYLWTKLHKIYIGNEIIQTTEIHRFYIKRAGLAQWLPASDLRAGDLMYLASGEWQAIDKIEIKKRFRKVYNFEVFHNHNYYVSETKILAHNKGGCFIAGTLVTTDQGFKNIENIQIGDIVLSYDEQKKQNVYSQVAQTMIHFVKEPIYTLYIANETLKVTGIHRFFIKRNNNISWIHASDIQVGDLVLFANETWNEIFKIESKFRFRKVYNFEVSNTHNYYVGKNQILAHNKGGGGGGRRARRNRAEGTKTNEGIERYHVVTTQYGKLENALKKVATAYDRAFGKDKLKLLDEQIKKQQALISKEEEYVKEIEKYEKADKKRLAYNGKFKYWSETDNKFKSSTADVAHYLGLDVDFGEDGTILNYEEIMKAANKRKDKEAKRYRHTNEGNKKAERRWEREQARYDQLLEYFNQYEETQELLLDQKEKLRELRNELYDMQLEKVQITVQLKVDVEDDKLKVLDSLLERIEDDAYSAAERISLLGKRVDSSFSKIESYSQGLKDLFGNHGVDGEEVFNDFLKNGDSNILMLKKRLDDAEEKYKDGSGNSFTEAEADQIREWIEGYQEQLSELIQARKEVIEEIGTVMDANIERLDKITDKMSHLKDIANSYKNIVDLTGRQYLKINSQLYDAMSATNVRLSTQSIQMARTRVAQAQQQYTMLQQQYASISDQLSEQEKLGWQEQLSTAADYVQEMTSDYYSAWEEAIEAVNDRFESAMEIMAEDFNRTMGGLVGNLEGLANRMDLKKTIQDTLVPEYEKMYQLSKLISDAQKKIDESSNVKVQREIQKVQEKILAARESGQQLSQYEINYLQKELELKAAQLALEEASQVKSQVRMRRDSEGNFAYVYTADEKAVQDAEDEYNAKLYEMQKLNEEYINNLQSQIVDVEQQYISAMQEAADMYGVGTAEYYQAIQNIQADYQLYFNTLNEQLNTALLNQQETATVHADFYQALTGDIYQANVTLTTSWEETTLASLTGIQTMTEYQIAWKEATQLAYSEAYSSGLEWQAGMDEVYAAAGTSVEEYSTTVANAFTQIIEDGNNTVTEMDAMAENVNAAINSIVETVINWEQEFSQKIEDMMAECDQLISKLNELLAVMSGVSNASLDDQLEYAQAQLADAQANVAETQAALDKSTRNVARRKETVKRRKKKLSRRIRKAIRRVDKAKAAVRKAKKAVKNARTRRAKRKAQAALKKRQRTLRNAKRNLRRVVRKASRRQRTAYRRYTSAVRSYNSAVTTYKGDKKANEAALKNQNDWEKEVQRLQTLQAEQNAKNQEASAQTNEENPTQNANLSAQTVSQSVDTNLQATLEAIRSYVSKPPTVTLASIPDFNQNVTITLPNVTDPSDIVVEALKEAGNAASLFIGRKN